MITNVQKHTMIKNKKSCNLRFFKDDGTDVENDKVKSVDNGFHQKQDMRNDRLFNG